VNSNIEALFASNRGLLVAPAGCGKTRLIAEAVALRQTPRRQLVLTHTHAGVYEIRKHLRLLKASSSQARVETISGWALKYAASYPHTSGLLFDEPETTEQWNAVHEAATRLLKNAHVGRVVENSYSGIMVDEYQDCSRPQHQLILAVAELLPCRVLGDPLQGIFDFSGSVDWKTDVVPNFDQLPPLEKPWRWEQENANRGLGQWLLRVREQIQSGKDVLLQHAPAVWKHLDPVYGAQAQLAECKRMVNNIGESVVAINKWPNQHHSLTSRLKGLFTCVEAIDCPELFQFAIDFEQKSGPQRAAAVLEFASICMTKVKSQLHSAIVSYSSGKSYKPHANADAPHFAALHRVASENTMSAVRPALQRLAELPDNRIHRRELYDEMILALCDYSMGTHTSLREAAWSVRSRTRTSGRKLGLRVAGSTLLVKGMEFQHALILDADKLNSKELYVAMTRGTQSLTIFSKSPVLRPHLNST